MRLPYGIAHFGELRREGYFLVDKTRYLHQLEREDLLGHQLFMRPRRFGKSILTTMLELYYDRIRARSHGMLFGGLAVGPHETAGCHGYYALRLDFNLVNTDLGTGSILSEFRNRIRGTFQEFFLRYWQELPEQARQWDSLPAATDPASRMRHFLELMSQAKYPLFLIVDGLDSFALDLIAHDDLETCLELTRPGGSVYELCAVLLEGITQGTIRRSFFAGVSSAIHRELFQQSSLLTDLTHLPAFQGLVGWSQEEVSAAVDQRLKQERFHLEAAPLLETLRLTAGGYRFAPESEGTVFNPDMVVYFLMGLEPPDILPDSQFDLNLHTEVNRFKYLLMNADGRPRAGLKNLLGTLCRDGGVRQAPGASSALADFFHPESFANHLYDMGLLTARDGDHFRIPNGAIRQMMWETVAGLLQRGGRVGIHITPLVKATYRLAQQGDATPLLSLILGQGINRLVSRAGWHGEPLTGDARGMLQVLWAFLCLTDIFRPLEPNEPVRSSPHGGAPLLVLVPGPAHQELGHGLILALQCQLEGSKPGDADTLLQGVMAELSAPSLEAAVLPPPGLNFVRVGAAVTLEGAVYCQPGGEVKRPSSV